MSSSLTAQFISDPVHSYARYIQYQENLESTLEKKVINVAFELHYLFFNVGFDKKSKTIKPGAISTKNVQ